MDKPIVAISPRNKDIAHIATRVSTNRCPHCNTELMVIMSSWDEDDSFCPNPECPVLRASS